MADGKTRIDPDGALRENQRLREIAQRFHDAKARLADAASSHDGCWGSDEFGQAFAKSYVPSSQQTMKNVGVVEDSLAAVEKNVNTAVYEFQQTDDNNASALSRHPGPTVRSR